MSKPKVLRCALCHDTIPWESRQFIYLGLNGATRAAEFIGRR